MQLEQLQNELVFKSSETRHNLPTRPTLLVGRNNEIKQITALLHRPQVRLLTLSGPGGVGKTRLALQVATELTLDFEDGVFLATVSDCYEPQQLLETIAGALGLSRETPQDKTGLLENLKELLHNKRMLLVLDGFEQLTVAGGGAVVSELLAAASGLKVLVTSRTLLRIYGEHEFVIGTLTYPDNLLTSPQALLEYGAIALLVQRIRAVRVDFCLTEENAATVARICRHLDGLPLALELAAARCKVLSPQELLARLESASDYNTLRLLNNGSRDLPQRHQTLRTNLDWSYGLLDECEKILLARLAVFRASFSLEAVEAICSVRLTDADFCCDLLDCLGALLDNSMLGKTESADGTVRFIMLNTVKEYALEKLAERGELEIMRQRHAKYYIELAKKAGYEWSVTEQANLQVARDWLGLSELEEALTEPDSVKEELQLDELSSHEAAIKAAKVKPVEVPAHSYSLNKTRTNLPNGLTRREIEVLRLVTQGLTNVQVAEKLVLAPRTVNVHLTSIYSKLGVNSRTAATRFAFDQNLI